MIKLVFIDVDGTLHGPNGVPDCAWEAARRARQAGLHLSLATGRPSTGISLEYAKRLDPRGHHVFHQGAAVVRGDGVSEYAVPFPQSAQHHLVDLARLTGLPLEVYTAEGGFYVERWSDDLSKHGALLEALVEHEDLHFSRQLGTVIRLQWVVRPGALWSSVREYIDERFSQTLSWHVGTSPATPGVIYASLLERSAGKLAAARWVADKLGVPLSQAAMIGDGENDLELLRAVGHGIAMGNAPEAVKRAAGLVVGSVDECGLAEALEALLPFTLS